MTQSGDIHDRLDNVHVAGAPAQVSFDEVAHFFPVELVMLAHKIDGAHDEARSTEAALERVMACERSLDWVQLAICGEAFDCLDRTPICLHGQHRARLHRIPVDQDRAAATLGRVTPDVRTRQRQLFADGRAQQRIRLNFQNSLKAVDG